MTKEEALDYLLKADDIDFTEIPCIKEYAKHHAGLAFDAGKREGDYFPTFGEPPVSKDEYLKLTFNT